MKTTREHSKKSKHKPNNSEKKGKTLVPHRHNPVEECTSFFASQMKHVRTTYVSPHGCSLSPRNNEKKKKSNMCSASFVFVQPCAYERQVYLSWMVELLLCGGAEKHMIKSSFTETQKKEREKRERDVRKTHRKCKN